MGEKENQSALVKQTIWRSLLLAIVPLFFGSFLFAGILEDYKNDTLFRKTIVEDLYRPMIDAHHQFQKAHNSLVLEYSTLAGSFQIMYNEMEHIADKSEIGLGGDYPLWLKATLESHQETKGKVEILQSEVIDLREKLYRRYEELALMTGTYHKYRELIASSNNKINALYKERTEKAGEIGKGIELKDVMTKMRNALMKGLNSQNLQDAQKYKDLVVKLNLMLCENEQKIFEEENKLFENLHNLFADEISSRFKRGFIRTVLDIIL